MHACCDELAKFEASDSGRSLWKDKLYKISKIESLLLPRSLTSSMEVDDPPTLPQPLAQIHFEDQRQRGQQIKVQMK